jgi:hypothetical protein
MSPWLRIIVALAIGIFVTALTAAVASALSSDSARELVFWPNTLLQYLVRAPNVGTPDHPLYEGTALNFFAFFVSFPFAVVVYAAVAYVCLRRFKT